VISPTPRVPRGITTAPLAITSCVTVKAMGSPTLLRLVLSSELTLIGTDKPGAMVTFTGAIAAVCGTLTAAGAGAVSTAG
jgi:hypothetical protein